MSPLARRTAGVLLHPTSLPGPHGSGDLGPDAYRFIDWLVAAGQRIWQLLPLNPVGPGSSPYQSSSAFAGSPLLVALEPLIERGWLSPAAAPAFEPGRVDFGRVAAFREQRLREAARGFSEHASGEDRAALAAWSSANASWLEDYALFMALCAAHEQRPWWEWGEALARRDPDALAAARVRHADELGYVRFVQWCFDMQAHALKRYASERGVALMGDVPIFVAHHSADCWARPDLYQLDEQRLPTVVAGVPPDLFSPTGQRWGNPLYRWDAMAKEGYAWWIARVRRALEHVDLFRIDHFRGFQAYYAVPADAPTASDGAWTPGPGRALFEALEQALGKLPVVAEDLGMISPDVIELRDACGFPGMLILQFAFSDDVESIYLPHNHVARAVVYTGTHDNDTVRGWWDSANEQRRACLRTYLGEGALGTDGHDVHWTMVRVACTSVAQTAIFPLQDLLGLDNRHRMNLPGTVEGNWVWRYSWDMIPDDLAGRLRALVTASGRAPR